MPDPRRRLHRLRGGDGPSVPDIEPPDIWPEFDDLDDYWESFQAFAYSEMPGEDIDFSFHINGRSGQWRFEAFYSAEPEENYGGTVQSETHRLTYDPSDDEMEMTISTMKGETGWVLEDAFGKPTSANSAL